MIKLTFVFPGQGSQFVGMGRDLFDNFKTAKELFEEACDSIHLDIMKLCFVGPGEELDLTHNTQPALLTASMAAYRVLCEESGLEPDFMAGHSLGEYTALTAADAINFSDAIRLARFRGNVMNEASGAGIGMMAAIIGLSRSEVAEVISEVKNDKVLTAANYNCPGQIVLSGHKEAVELAMEGCRRKGAKRAIPLPVSGPFHSALMEEASVRLKEYLGGVGFDTPRCAVYSNVTAAPYTDAAEIAGLLVRQIKSSVMWEDSVGGIIDQGADAFVEVGPGKVLSGLVKRISKEVLCCGVSDTASLKETIASVSGIRNS